MTGADVRVTALRRYPVKACAGEDLDRAAVGVAGLRNDRVLAVVVDGRIVTQREFARLARVRPALDDAGARLTLAYDGQGTAGGVVETTGPTREVTLFGQPVTVVDQSRDLSRWISEVLGRPAELVGAPATTRRTSPGAVEGQTVLSDEGTVSLHSDASLARLNARLAERGHPGVPADRFRANLVITGCGPHAEDDTDTFEVGEVRMAFAQVDVRCVVTTVDQSAGARSGPEPLRTLAAYRRVEGGGAAFGVYTAVVAPGTVRMGDPVTLPRS